MARQRNSSFIVNSLSTGFTGFSSRYSQSLRQSHHDYPAELNFAFVCKRTEEPDQLLMQLCACLNACSNCMLRAEPAFLGISKGSKRSVGKGVLRAMHATIARFVETLWWARLAWPALPTDAAEGLTAGCGGGNSAPCTSMLGGRVYGSLGGAIIVCGQRG
jgi:hypothetical protein